MRVYEAGQRRIYLKADEGKTFIDRMFRRRRSAAELARRHRTHRAAAHAAGLKVGAYHFARPGSNNPREEARHFCAVVGEVVPGKDLRPCLDFEIGATSAVWAHTWLDEVAHLLGVRPIIYSYADFLQRSHFPGPAAPLWLASYGRNDGVEHPFSIPSPWRSIVAHQFSSNARVAGVPGRVDISHVFNGAALDVPSRL